jgi:hypothetical protein
MSGDAKSTDWTANAVIATLAVACALGFAHFASTIPLHVSDDPNEGWNAYHAAALAAGAPLYPQPPSFFVNNYPPLFFYLEAFAGGLAGDYIIAGRVISLIALTISAIGIGIVVRELGAKRLEAVFAALFFVAWLLLFSDYVAMNDPQLVGHALDLCACALVIKAPRSLATLFAAAALLSAAFFFKHNLIVMPLALVLWLAIYERRSAFVMAGSGLAFLAVGLIAFRLAYGLDLIAALNSGRLYSIKTLSASLLAWLPWAALPLVASNVVLVQARKDKHAMFCGIYLLIATAIGVAFLGGAGVDVNALFDADIALALTAGLALAKVSERARLWRLATLAAWSIPLAAGVALAFQSDWITRDFWIHPSADEVKTAEADIVFLRAREGSAICEQLALCYWAGKPQAVDVFNLGQQFATGKRGDNELAFAIEQRRFSTIQFDALAPFPLSLSVKRMLDENYRVDHFDDSGVFLVPKA